MPYESVAGPDIKQVTSAAGTRVWTQETRWCLKVWRHQKQQSPKEGVTERHSTDSISPEVWDLKRATAYLSLLPAVQQVVGCLWWRACFSLFVLQHFLSCNPALAPLLLLIVWVSRQAPAEGGRAIVFIVLQPF